MTELAERRKIYQGSPWGEYCISLPCRWVNSFHELALSDGLEFIDIGQEVLYARFASVSGATEERPWEAYPLPLCIIRNVKPHCPIIRKDKSAREVRTWFERARRIGKTKTSQGSLVVAIPALWIETQLAGEKVPDHLWVHAEGEFLVIALRGPEIQKLDGPWRDGAVPTINVRELARVVCTRSP
jgi:hypothetical protein